MILKPTMKKNSMKKKMMKRWKKNSHNKKLSTVMISFKKIFQPVTVLYQIIDPFFIALSFKCKCKSLLSTFKNLFLITFYYGITFCLFLSVSILDRESAYSEYFPSAVFGGRQNCTNLFL